MHIATSTIRYDSIDANFLQKEGVQVIIIDQFAYSEKEERTTSIPPIEYTQICRFSKSGALIQSEEYDEHQDLYQVKYLFYQQDGRISEIQEQGLGGYVESLQFRYFDIYNIVVQVTRNNGIPFGKCRISKYDEFGKLLMNKVNSYSRSSGYHEIYNYFINGSIFSYRTKLSEKQLLDLFADQSGKSDISIQYPYSRWFHGVFLSHNCQVVERDGRIAEVSIVDISGNVNSRRKFEYNENGLLKIIETTNFYGEQYEVIMFRYFQDRESLACST